MANWLKTNVPVVGGLFGDGAKTSGAAAFAAVSAVVLSLACEPWIKAVCLTGLGAAWIIGGALKR